MKQIKRFSIDESRCTSVPKEDIERFKEAMQRRVIRPMLERRKRQAQLIDIVRRRVVF